MITVQPRKNKRGLQQLSDAQKMEAITKVQKGETKAAVAREFGVPESTLRGWCKKAKLNGHCHSSISKSQPVSSTVSPLLVAPEMAYRDCNRSKESGSEEGSSQPFSDEQEEEMDSTPPKLALPIPEEERRVIDWVNNTCYARIAAQSTFSAERPTQPVVTSSTCDDVKSAPETPKITAKHKQQTVKGFAFYDWYKTHPTCEGYLSPISPISPESTDKLDSYECEPLALIVPSKRRISDIETSFKNFNKIYHARQDENNINNNNHTTDKHTYSSSNNNNNNNNNNHHHQHQHHHINNNHIIINNNNNNGYVKPTVSVEEALKHGELFLDWLKDCSHPNVTVLQAVQLGTLIKNIRSSLERNQNKR